MADGIIYKASGSCSGSARQADRQFVTNYEIIRMIILQKQIGFESAYRIRMGAYRIGFIFENETSSWCGCWAGEIYKYFPKKTPDPEERFPS